jgi:hypothetical protein
MLRHAVYVLDWSDRRALKAARTLEWLGVLGVSAPER